MRKATQRPIVVLSAGGALLDWVAPDGFAKLEASGVFARVIRHKKGFIRCAYLQPGAKYDSLWHRLHLQRVRSTWSVPGVAKCMSRSAALRVQRVAAAAGACTEAEWQEIVARADNRCLRCGASGTDVPLTKDHIVPLAKGGTNCASNLQPLCRVCNSWKGNREIDFSRAILAA
jgi:5-methylcytosine-specific restriction endonuclease McrA